MLTNYYFQGLQDHKAIGKQKRDQKKPPKTKNKNRGNTEDYYASGKIKFNWNEDDDKNKKHKNKNMKAKEWVKMWDPNDSA